MSAQQMFIRATDYMFRLVNRSSSGLQQNKSNVLLRDWDLNVCNQI